MARTQAIKRSLRLGLALSLIAGLSACGARYSNHGYIPPQEDLDQIVVGIDTRASVEETLGPSATGSVADDNGLYYVRSRVRKLGMFEPQVVERQVLAVSFDGQGVLRNVETFGLEDGQVVPLSRRITDSGVVNKTFLRQLLGNIGRIGPSAN